MLLPTSLLLSSERISQHYVNERYLYWLIVICSVYPQYLCVPGEVLRLLWVCLAIVLDCIEKGFSLKKWGHESRWICILFKYLRAALYFHVRQKLLTLFSAFVIWACIYLGNSNLWASNCRFWIDPVPVGKFVSLSTVHLPNLRGLSADQQVNPSMQLLMSF